MILGKIISDNKVVNGPIWSMKFLDKKQIIYGGLGDFISVVPVNNKKMEFHNYFAEYSGVPNYRQLTGHILAKYISSGSVVCAIPLT